MASSATKKESSITLQYHSEKWELTFKARYGIDGEERMEVDNELADQYPLELHLKSRDRQGCELSYVFPGIQDDVRRIHGFIQRFMNSPGVIMKTVRCIICYLLEKNTLGIHLVPDNEQLLITKVDEHDGTSTFSHRSDPASDIISFSELEQINNFVGVHWQKFWLLSVLWLLSELAVKQFGQQG